MTAILVKTLHLPNLGNKTLFQLALQNDAVNLLEDNEVVRPTLASAIFERPLVMIAKIVI